MKFLIIKDINTDEEVNRVEIENVKNVSVMKGNKINEIGVWYGCKVDSWKDYIMVQYDTKEHRNCFVLCEKSEGYIIFE